MQEYTVTISNTYEADSAEDAVLQMVAYLIDTAHRAGYRIDAEDGTTVFLDAEELGIS